MVLKSFAKVNFYLTVLKTRKDHYHNLRTLFSRIDLADQLILTLRPRDKKIKIICSSLELPRRASANLAYQSAKLLQHDLKVNQGVEIRIRKNIPVAAGLGGSSSNAAFTLLGLNKLWKLGLKRQRLVNLGRKLGADVPFFLYQSRFALGSLRGDAIRPLKILAKAFFWQVVVVPRIKVSTPRIYAVWDRLKVKQKAKLTISKLNVKLINLAFRQKNPGALCGLFFNSLEEVSLKLYPEIQQVKDRFLDLGVKTILMSGSGPAVFGIVATRKEAVSLSRRLKTNRSWRVFVTKTI